MEGVLFFFFLEKQILLRYMRPYSWPFIYYSNNLDKLAEGNFTFNSPPQIPLQALIINNMTPIWAPHWQGHREFSFYTFGCYLDHIWHTGKKFQLRPPECYFNSLHTSCFGHLAKVFWAEQPTAFFAHPVVSSNSCQIHPKALGGREKYLSKYRNHYLQALPHLEGKNNSG